MTNATWLFTWPLALMASTFDAWAQLLRQWQDATVKGLESIMPAAAAAQLPQMACDAGAMPVRKEPDVLSNRDYDLSGEDRLKLVRYKIVFLKRDHEVAFPEKEELVAYDTSAADWAGIKVAHFMGELREWSEQKRDELAPRWTRGGRNYPPRDKNGRFCIPPDDERYVKVYFEVLQRWDRMEADYEKRRTEAIENIRDAVKSFGGPKSPEC